MEERDYIIKLHLIENTDFFAIITKHNFFKIYNYDFMAPIISFDLKDKYIDFCFGPCLDFSWLRFTAFFLNTAGDVFYICPLFLPKFELTIDYYSKMREFYENSIKSEINYELKKEYEFNMIILEEIKKSSVIKSNSRLKVELNHYLKNLNLTNSFNLRNLLIVNKTFPSTQKDLGNQKEISIYNQIYSLNFWPLTLVLATNNGVFEFVVFTDHINPTITNYNYENKIGFLLKAINLDSDITTFPNLKINLLYNPSKKYEILIQYLHDILLVDLSWIEINLSNLSISSTKIHKFQSKATFEIEKITKINYSNAIKAIKENNNKNSKQLYGYYGLINELNFSFKLFFLGTDLFLINV